VRRLCWLAVALWRVPGCPPGDDANAADLDTLIKHLELDAWRIACREWTGARE